MVKKAKIIFLGDTAVGKSCIINAINGHPISNTHQPTIGMDFSTKVYNGCSEQYRLQLWDTAGQQKFRSIMPSYIRNSRLAVLVYDVTNTKSFLNLDKWIQMFHECAFLESKLIIVGNKIDLYNDRRVTMQKVQQKIIKSKIKYLEISAKTSEGINDLVEQIVKQLEEMNIPLQRNSLTQSLNENENKKKCCTNG